MCALHFTLICSQITKETSNRTAGLKFNYYKTLLPSGGEVNPQLITTAAVWCPQRIIDSVVYFNCMRNLEVE